MDQAVVNYWIGTVLDRLQEIRCTDIYPRNVPYKRRDQGKGGGRINTRIEDRQVWAASVEGIMGAEFTDWERRALWVNAHDASMPVEEREFYYQLLPRLRTRLYWALRWTGILTAAAATIPVTVNVDEDRSPPEWEVAL